MHDFVRGQEARAARASLEDSAALNGWQQSWWQAQEPLRVCVVRMGQARLGEGAAAQRLAAELVAGINHVQYNQGNDINAFAGMVISTRACTRVHAVSHSHPRALALIPPFFPGAFPALALPPYAAHAPAHALPCCAFTRS